MFIKIQKYSSERAIDTKIIRLSECFSKQRKGLQETNSERGDDYYSTQKIADNL